MNELKQLEDLLYNESEGLLIELRFNTVLNLKPELINEIKLTLKNLSKRWENTDYIPKRACDIFVDFYPAMENVAAQYNEDDCNKILELADEIMFLIRDCYSFE